MKTVKVGNVARCGNGKLGVVTAILGSNHTTDYKTTFYGIKFNGQNWSSTKPEFVAENIDNYLLMKRAEIIQELN